MAGDVNYNQVALLLHFDGADGTTVFTDNSGTPKTVTRTGTTTISTARSQWGGASGLFPGSGSYLSAPSDAAFNMAGDFTLEGWVYLPALTSTAYLVNRKLLTSAPVSGDWAVNIDATTGALNFFTTAANVFTGISITAASWHHWAITRTSTTIRGFIDGVMASNTFTDGTNFTTTRTLEIGRFDNVPNVMTGSQDDLRITVGVARYATNFVLPTAAFPDTLAVGSAQLVLTAPMQTLSAFTGAAIGVTAPMQTLAVYGGDLAQLTAPMQAVASYCGGQAAMAAPMPTILFVAHDATGENGAALTAPMATLTAFGGANAAVRAPSPTIAITATFSGLASAALTGPMQTVAATGTVSAVASANLTAPIQNVVGYGGAVIAVTCPIGAMQATGAAGAIGSIAVICPLFELVASATANAHAEVSLIAPMQTLGQHRLQAWLVAPMAQLVAIGSAVVTASYEAYSLNLNHKGFKDPVDELTRYTNFPFTHIVRYQNSYFGVAADGLYLLEGTTDFDPSAPTVPSAIEWAWKTGLSDFDVTEKKTLVSAYFGGRLGHRATVTQYIGEAATQRYNYASVRGPDAQNYRQKFGLGIKARYQGVAVAGEGELALDTIDFNIANLSRRI